MDQPSEAHPTPTTLYRLYGHDDTLLYIGIAGNPGRRFEEHRRDKLWWGDVAVAKLEHHPSRSLAEAHEAKAIRSEQPLHNLALTGKPPAEPCLFIDEELLSDGRRALDVAAEIGISRNLYLNRRYRAWSPERAATTPAYRPSGPDLKPGDTWGKWTVVGKERGYLVLRHDCGRERGASSAQLRFDLNCPPCWRAEQGHRSLEERMAERAAKDEERYQAHPVGATRNGWTILEHLGFKGSGLRVVARHFCGAEFNTTAQRISNAKNPERCPCGEVAPPS